MKRLGIAAALIILGLAVWSIANDEGGVPLVSENRHTFGGEISLVYVYESRSTLQAVVIDPTPYITDPRTFDTSIVIFVREYGMDFGAIGVSLWLGGRFFFPGVPGVDLVELYRPQGRAEDAEGNPISLADIPIGAIVEIEFDGLMPSSYPTGLEADLIRVVG